MSEEWLPLSHPLKIKDLGQDMWRNLTPVFEWPLQLSWNVDFFDENRHARCRWTGVWLPDPGALCERDMSTSSGRPHGYCLVCGGIVHCPLDGRGRQAGISKIHEFTVAFKNSKAIKYTPPAWGRS